MLKETVEIVSAMWTQEETTYSGTYYQTHRANCDPKPLQQPRIPIWIGGGGEQLTLRVVARYADYSNFGGTPEEFARKNEILRGHCEKVGREETSIRRTWSPEILIRTNDRELREAQQLSIRRESFDVWKAANLIGTPDEVAHKIGTYRDLGCSGFIPWCVDYPAHDTLEHFAGVMQQFR
jgi:alkanesulfonate monooxygenase SsuD/methylene tetrahydromethanopterin reductase-like flavin-dependent oxidoreductase (luciferase family)